MGQHINFCPIKSLCRIEPSSVNPASITNPVGIESIVSDGTNWCIKYTDGWIEQGGFKTVTSIAAYGTVDVTFNDIIDGVNTGFTSTPIYIHCTPVYTGSTNGLFSAYGVELVSSTGFIYRNTFSNSNNLSGFYWVAKGI